MLYYLELRGFALLAKPHGPCCRRSLSLWGLGWLTALRWAGSPRCWPVVRRGLSRAGEGLSKPQQLTAEIEVRRTHHHDGPGPLPAVHTEVPVGNHQPRPDSTCRPLRASLGALRRMSRAPTTFSCLEDDALVWEFSKGAPDPPDLGSKWVWAGTRRPI